MLEALGLDYGLQGVMVIPKGTIELFLEIWGPFVDVLFLKSPTIWGPF